MDKTKAVVTKSGGAFRMECAVEIAIGAGAERVWALLTDAARFPSWNSTVTRIEGQIAEGQALKITVPAAPGRVFKPKVSGWKAGESMVWSDGMAPMFKGVRTFTLSPGSDGTTRFVMREAFSGIMLPMIKGSLPDFGPIFATYAEDLKRAAEVAS